MKHIPHDVWLHIAQFLPKEVLAGLYSVNRTFFELAMDARYGEVQIPFAIDRIIIPWKAKRLRDPAAAQRVRTLRFQLSAFDWLASRPRSRPRALIHFLLRRKLLTGRRAIKWSFPQAIGGLERVLTGFHGVTEFSVDCEWFPESLAIASSLISASWNTFGNKLQRLTLSFSSSALYQLFSGAPPLNLGSLVELKIELWQEHFLDTPVDPDPVIEVLLPFIAQFQPALEALSFSSQVPTYDYTMLLTALPLFRHLTRLSLRIPFHPAKPALLPTTERFVCTHAPALTHLVLVHNLIWESESSVPLPPLRAAAWLADADLPPLRALTIDLALLGPTIDAALPFLRRAVCTVAHLALDHAGLTPDDITAVARACAQPGAQCTTLRLRIRHLSVDALDALAHDLPQLRALELRVLRDPADAPTLPAVSPTAPFCATVRKRVYAGWALTRVGVWLDYYPPASVRCAQAIANAVPPRFGVPCAADDVLLLPW